MKQVNIFVLFHFILLSSYSLFCQNLTAKEGFSLLITAYPDETMTLQYDKEIRDWFIRLNDQIDLYWADGRVLPKELLAEKDDYQKMFYFYPKKSPDPKKITEKELEKIVRFSNPENRRKSKKMSAYFFDTIYSSGSQIEMERQLVSILFLGHTVSVHKKIVKPLQRVETQLRTLAERSKEVQNFIDTLGFCDVYYWRSIVDSPNRSFHSFGLAIDLLPVDQADQIIYWGWERKKGNDRWMLIPLEKRWIPPADVIDSFEKEGFIWGGKWVIWDNMHFEYRPEILAYQKKKF